MRRITIALLSTLIAVPAVAERHRAVGACLTCPTPAPVWYAKEVPRWNEAIAELIEENGDPDYYIMPLSGGERWLVVWKGTATGSVMHTGYGAKSFRTASEAVIVYDSRPSDNRRLIDWHDGSVLVVWKCGGQGEGCEIP